MERIMLNEIIKDHKTLKIDKELNHVGYNDYKHLYFDKGSGLKYISCTTLIHEYQQPFDKEYWSQYKAIERILTPTEFKDLKSEVGYKNVVSQYQNLISDNQEKITQLNETTQQILNEWQQTNAESLKKGTAYHKEKEDFYTSKMYAFYNSVKYNVCTNNDLRTHEFGIHPELLIYDDEFKIAGQVDLLIKTGNKITIRDYKTNKKLVFNNAFQNMKYPLEHLSDCNFNHYQLQLSLYAYMINKMYGYEITDLYIDHYTGTESISYRCNYLYNEVIDLISYYTSKK